MEEIKLTDGQFQRLLNATGGPEEYTTPEIRSLVGALHKAERKDGHQWRVRLTESDVTLALNIFEEHRRIYRTPAAKQAWNFFIRASLTARRLHDERQEQSDVPRETKDDR